MPLAARQSCWQQQDFLGTIKPPVTRDLFDPCRCDILLAEYIQINAAMNHLYARDDLAMAMPDDIGSSLLRGMIDWICKESQMSAVDAYMLCSVAGDLRISEIVDMPNWVVSFYFPKSILG